MTEPNSTAVIAVRVGARWFGAEVAHVREVVPQQPVTRVPSLPAHIAGLASIRGRAVPVVELAQLVRDIPPGEPARTAPRLVVLHAGDREVALAVDETRGVLRLERQAPLPGTTAQLVAASVTWNDRAVRMLDVRRLVHVVEGTAEP